MTGAAIFAKTTRFCYYAHLRTGAATTGLLPLLAVHLAGSVLARSYAEPIVFDDYAHNTHNAHNLRVLPGNLLPFRFWGSSKGTSFKRSPHKEVEKFTSALLRQRSSPLKSPLAQRSRCRQDSKSYLSDARCVRDRGLHLSIQWILSTSECYRPNSCTHFEAFTTGKVARDAVCLTADQSM